MTFRVSETVDGGVELGKISRSGVQTVPPGRNETFLEGRAVLQAYLPNREAGHSTAWPARTQRPPRQAYRLRRAVTRKTKSQTHLRNVGAPVSSLFSKSDANERRNRREPARAA